MRQRALVRVGVLALAASPLHAQTPSIQHQAVGCVVAEKFPRLEARFSPGDAVATARVLFQTETTQAWYAVAMKADGVSFVGVLPKPKKSLQTFRYYIEVTDRSMGTSRTSDYTTAVVTASTACKGKGIMAGALGSATVLLQAPVGAAALPVGFASSGVVAAGSGAAAGATGAASTGGGLSTGAVVGIVGGVGAVGAAVAVAASKSDSKNATMSYSGPITTHLALTQNITAAGPGGAPTTSTCVFDHALGGTMVITLQQSSGTATGRGQTSLTDSPVSVTGPSTCSNSGAASGPGVGGGISCDITGSPSDLGCSGTMTNTSGNGPVTFTLAFSGGLNGGVISGNVTYSVTGQLGFPGGTNNFSGSTAFAVTLR